LALNEPFKVGNSADSAIPSLAAACGLAARALEEALRWAQARRQFGRAELAPPVGLGPDRGAFVDGGSKGFGYIARPVQGLRLGGTGRQADGQGPGQHFGARAAKKGAMKQGLHRTLFAKKMGRLPPRKTYSMS
jgi:hypothetical protein